ncbi:MAG: hypothetical protein K6G30_10395 [Acetatifactor sp.]|nr:hypothetical protein [Acetatifactor sp.]
MRSGETMICTYATEHYLFHYLDKSTASKDIVSIAEKQERCFEEICRYLSVNYPNRISYWLYESAEVIGTAFFGGGATNGLTIYYEEGEEIGKTITLSGKAEDSFAIEPYSIHAVYNEEVKCIGFHEDTHMISAQWNCPPSVFLNEGLAMFMDKVWWGIDNKEWCRKFKKEGTMIPTDKVLCLECNQFVEIPSEKSYPVAGAWTRYVLETYGLEKYKEFFCSINFKDYESCKDYKASSVKILGCTLHQIHEDFLKWLEVK